MIFARGTRWRRREFRRTPNQSPSSEELRGFWLNALLTASVSIEPVNKTDTVPKPFYMTSLSCETQISASPKTMPATMHTTHSVKQILLSVFRFINQLCACRKILSTEIPRRLRENLFEQT